MRYAIKTHSRGFLILTFSALPGLQAINLKAINYTYESLGEHLNP